MCISSNHVLILVATVLTLASLAILALTTPYVGQWLFDRAARQMAAQVNIAPLADNALRSGLGLFFFAAPGLATKAPIPFV